MGNCIQTNILKENFFLFLENNFLITTFHLSKLKKTIYFMTQWLQKLESALKKNVGVKSFFAKYNNTQNCSLFHHHISWHDSWLVVLPDYK